VAYWIRVNYERNEYVVDLDRLSAFACAPNGKITFWLPNSSIPIIINQQSNPEGYQQVHDYIQHVSAHSLSGSWIQVMYERNEYIIDLNRISSFCHSSSGRLTFWLPDSSIPIIINEQKDQDTYQKILDFIQRKTGHILP
jgi:hypothetical protein